MIKEQILLERQKAFIEEAQKIHGNKYDYSKVIYKGSRIPVTIICPIHGEFYPTPNNHISRKSGCPICRNEWNAKHLKSSTIDFIEKARKVHGDKYDYSLVDYVNAKTAIKIKCPIHGVIEQTPDRHLRSCGCPYCGGSIKLTTEQFISKAKEIHGDKYDYSKAKYVNAHTPITIICPIHGEFQQKPSEHLSGYGCKQCGIERRSQAQALTTDKFIERAKKVHGDKYDYSKVEYINSSTPITIICKKHGEFQQRPDSHLQGQGCPICNSSKLELEMRDFLIENKVNLECQKRFDWLGRQSLDFYLPDYNAAIECQGEQHFKPVEHFGGVDRLKDTIERDKKKKILCEEHDIKIMYFSNTQYNKEIFIDKNKMLREIIEENG